MTSDDAEQPTDLPVAPPCVADDGPLTGGGVYRLAVQAWQEDGAHLTRDWVAGEQPVAFVYRCVSHAVMMATPCDLLDFAVGFSLSEGIIEHAHQLYDIEVHEQAGGIELRMDLASERLARLRERRREGVAASGCGLCGLTSLEAVVETLPAVSRNATLAPPALQAALAALGGWQQLGRLSGAMHCAAWCDLEGGITLLREDVGRHNALDKLIGALARARQVRPQGFALLSSRASYELVQKAVQAGIEILVTVSAATSLAVELAERCGLTLVGFARPGRHVVYCHAWRFREGASTDPVSGRRSSG